MTTTLTEPQIQIVSPSFAALVVTLDDLENLRIAMENRYRSLTTSGVSENGHHWGSQGIEDVLIHVNGEKKPLTEHYLEMVEVIQAQEKAAISVVEKIMKASPLGEYVKDAKGVGLKQAARLLAAVGDPFWHTVEDRPRKVSELWAYCGMDVRNGRAPRRAKGQQANWNGEARKRAWLVAKSVEKQTSGKYREMYDATKAHYAEAVHSGYDCAQCHAKDGEPLKPGHVQSRALRRVAKEVLKDMWIASRDQHEKALTEAA